MDGNDALIGLKEAVIEVLQQKSADPSPSVGRSNMRQIANSLVSQAITSNDSVEAIQLIITILNISGEQVVEVGSQ